MKIVFLVGTFPQLTFIYRMTVMVAQRGHEVIVAARDEGNWKNFAEDVQMPHNMTVRYLLPTGGFRHLGRMLRVMGGLLTAITSHPARAYKLWQMCRTHEKTRGSPIRYFFGHLRLLDLSADVYQLEFFVNLPLYPLLSQLHPDAQIVVSCRGADVHTLELQDEKSQQTRLDILKHADGIHCVSGEIAEEVTRLTGRTHNIWVNRPAIPINTVTAKTQYNTNDVPVIANVGRLNWKKGHDYLLEALRQLKAEGIPFRMEIIGDGELYAQMRFSIGDLGLEPEVQLLGRMSSGQVFEHLNKADIYVLSSYEEGISNAVLEAMAAGLPIVTTTAGGMEEAVRDGQDGFVVPVRDSKALAEKLKILLEDAPLREKMGRSARQQVEEAFTLERQARVFEEIYQSLVEQANR